MIRDSVGDWQELSALYERADALAGAALAAWLAELAAQRHPLELQLRRMLAARDVVAESAFLSSLPGIVDNELRGANDWSEGSRIGRYRLIRRIGEGGMAEVWLADRADGAFTRQVAIKLLYRHPARSQREAFAARFRRERDILASLAHPNIAGLHDAGVMPTGHPWLALEYVEGEPIAAWCDERHLSVKERLTLFNQVLLAVEAAHASLIIHRDIKPSNILVSGSGEVKLLDFGIAKLLDPDENLRGDTALTREGGHPLTLQYASPEQLAGRPLTTLTDVFSLGLVLYELLSGSRPYDASKQSAAQLAQLVAQGAPWRIGRSSVAEAEASARGTTAR